MVECFVFVFSLETKSYNIRPLATYCLSVYLSASYFKRFALCKVTKQSITYRVSRKLPVHMWKKGAALCCKEHMWGLLQSSYTLQLCTPGLASYVYSLWFLLYYPTSGIFTGNSQSRCITVEERALQWLWHNRDLWQQNVIRQFLTCSGWKPENLKLANGGALLFSMHVYIRHTQRYWLETLVA
jgi:hypothetical protein